MAVELPPLTIEDLFQEISDLARDYGVPDQSVWNELVEQVLESHMAMGELSDDQNYEGYLETLKQKWDAYKHNTLEEELGQTKDEPFGQE